MRPVKAEGAEDAQAKEKAAEAFANTLAENRKYGEGLIIAEQSVQAGPGRGQEYEPQGDAPAHRRGRPALPRRDHGPRRVADPVRDPAVDRRGFVYADEYPEATLAEIKPRLSALEPQPVVRRSTALLFCAPARQCEFRGAGLAISRDAGLRNKMDARMAALTKPGLEPRL